MPMKWRWALAALVLVHLSGCNDNDRPNGNRRIDPTTDEIRIAMDEADVDELYSRDPWSDDRLPAEIVVPGLSEPIETGGLRFRGSFTRSYPRRSFNISFDDPLDYAFANDRREGGMRLNLNAGWTDPTGMRDALCFELYRGVDVPAPETRYAEVYLNEVYEGLFLSVERIDERFLDNWELNSNETDFLLVRDRSDQTALNPERSIFGQDIDALFPGDDAARIAGLQAIFDNRGDEDVQDWSPLLELVRWVNDTPAGPDYAEGFRERIDVPNFHDFVALHILTQDLDSLDDDYWLYRDNAANGPWRVIPWDKNLTFGTNFFDAYGGGANHFFTYTLSAIGTFGNELFIKYLDTPELREELHQRLRELMEDFSPEYFADRTAEIGQAIEGPMERQPGEGRFVRNPRQHFGEYGHFDEHVDALVEFVHLRYAWVERWIDPVGDVGSATVTLSGVGAGERVDFVDSTGWVLATIRPVSTVPDATVTIAIAPNGGLSGINREWTVETSVPFEADLTLYYRNDPVEDWTGTLDPVGSQRSLQVTRLDGNGTQAFETAVNPFANKATARVQLEGSSRFGLALP